MTRWIGMPRSDTVGNEMPASRRSTKKWATQLVGRHGHLNVYTAIARVGQIHGRSETETLPYSLVPRERAHIFTLVAPDQREQLEATQVKNMSRRTRYSGVHRLSLSTVKQLGQPP